MLLEGFSHPIVIQTRKGRDIRCEPPVPKMSPEDEARCTREMDRLKREMLPFPMAVWQRRGPTLDYNCHGLTFLARRAWLLDDDALSLVLADDGYRDDGYGYREVPLE
jgi:hypothetical protein